MNNFNEFDILVAVIMLISTMVSLIHGFVKDILSILAWVGSAVLTFVFYPMAAKELENYMEGTLVTNLAAIIGVYVASFTCVSLFNAMILDNLRTFRGGPVDRSLGTLFGLVKGFVIVGLLHFAIVLVAGKEPKWLEESKTYSFTSQSSQMFENFFADVVDKVEDPDAIRKDAKDALEQIPEQLEQGVEQITNDGAEQMEALPEQIQEVVPEQMPEQIPEQMNNAVEKFKEGEVEIELHQ
jgi:membrane protein required for colicin V production